MGPWNLCEREFFTSDPIDRFSLPFYYSFVTVSLYISMVFPIWSRLKVTDNQPIFSNEHIIDILYSFTRSNTIESGIEQTQNFMRLAYFWVVPRYLRKKKPFSWSRLQQIPRLRVFKIYENRVPAFFSLLYFVSKQLSNFQNSLAPT